MIINYIHMCMYINPFPSYYLNVLDVHEYTGYCTMSSDKFYLSFGSDKVLL